ncbi:MAG TPA: DUF962 domain-containing protein [Steroidobacteraceae bacterium]|jgi:hypothetical protein|nr:DUF962 domain-containing protein [Steroidobacteraceae bacterium]
MNPLPPSSAARTGFATFREFYPYYLQQHCNPISRRLHVAGTLLAIAFAVAALLSGRWLVLLAVPIAGYGPAWAGHFLFEHNSPATFTNPFYSLRGDLTLLGEVLSGRRRW